MLAALGSLLGSPRPAAAQFGPAPSYAAPSTWILGASPHFIAVGDVNKNGVLDLVIANNAGASVNVLLGNGTGGFAAATGSPFAVGTEPVAVAIGDLNNDTNPDLVVANYASNNLTVLLGDGTGAFAPAPVSPIIAQLNPHGVVITNMDADAFADLVVTNDGSNTVSVLLGNGASGFGAPASFPVAGNPRGLAVLDLNTDGRKDVVVTNYNAGAPAAANVSVLLGTATGFAAAVHYTTGTGARNVAMGDLNGDGRPDAVVANRVAGTVSVLMGSAAGDGTFLAAVNYGAGTGPFGVDVGDFNVDGKVDVAVANFDDTRITLLNGDGQGNLQAPGTFFTAGTNPAFVSAGDFNADGKLDLAVPNFGSNNASVFLNTLALSADLAMAKAGPANVTAGQNVVYMLTVTNNGPNNAAAVSVADPTPTGLVFVSNAGACTTAFPCALGTLNAGAVRTITSTYQVSSGYAGANPLQNTATAGSTTTDPTPGNNAATASTTVTFSADRSITKTGPANVTAGQNVVYTIMVSNTGPSDAAAVSVADPTPSGLTFLSNAGACTTAFPCALGAVPPGQVRTITSTFQVSSGYAGANPLQNTATVGSTTGDPAAGNNSATASTNVNFSADLSITKAGPANVTAGQNIVYTITVSNAGPSDAAAVSVADTTPSGLTFVSNAGACTTAFPCALGAVPAGQVRTITSTFLVPPGYAGPSPIQNTATVSSTTTDPTPGNNSSIASTAVGFSADMSISKTSPTNVTTGENLVYTITVTNNGPSNAAAVSVQDATPAGLTFVSNAGACTTAFPCALGALAAGQVRTITSTFLVPLGYSGVSPILNTATVSSTTADPSAVNNSSTASTIVGPSSSDLSITKVGPSGVVRGRSAVYTITVTNNGPSDAASVQVADPTPPGLTFVSNTGDCTTAFPCALGNVLLGATRTITATFAVPADYAGVEPVVNTATVSSPTPDPDSSNNSASASGVVDPLTFYTVSPCRVLDTRDPAGPLGGPALAPPDPRTFVIVGGQCGVPSTAKAVSVNVTVTQPSDPGDLRLYPAGSLPPLASTINYGVGQTRANNAVIKLGTGGAIDVLCDQGAGTVNFILDVNGYFEP